MKCWNGYHAEGKKKGKNGPVNDCKKDSRKINKPVRKGRGG